MTSSEWTSTPLPHAQSKTEDTTAATTAPWDESVRQSSVGATNSADADGAATVQEVATVIAGSALGVLTARGHALEDAHAQRLGQIATLAAESIVEMVNTRMAASAAPTVTNKHGQERTYAWVVKNGRRVRVPIEDRSGTQTPGTTLE